ncbi:MAG: hypothetical protein JNL60_06915 [Bacteroidia bacterium]|nr:hypothetical protein [Bacteroidia bacterium]
MKTLNVVLVSLLMLMTSCNAQQDEYLKNLPFLAEAGEANTDSLNKPDVRFKVNKKYDDRGNIVSYDSVYTYSYRGSNKGRLAMSPPENFPFPPGFSSSGFLNFPEMDPFANDTLFRRSFNDDYFEKQMQKNLEMMKEFMRGFPPVPQATPEKKQEVPSGKTI